VTRRGHGPLLLGFLVLVLTVAACGGPMRDGSPVTEARAGASAGPTPNAVAAIGEEVGVRLGDGLTLYLTIEALTPAAACRARVAPTQTPSGDVFLVLDVTARLAADAPRSDGSFAPLAAEQFRIVRPDGSVQVVTSTEASWACFEDDELLPPFLDAGDIRRGKVVLDSSTPHGLLVFAPGGAPGWEWAF
jgi:hypothetical protein